MNEPTHVSHEFYSPLAPGQIRVLELEAGEFLESIVGRLVPQPVIDGEPYEALSYVWGDKFKSRTIFIDGCALDVPENLHAALTAFRPRPSMSPSLERGNGEGKQIRRLWADAVCINQEDLPERILQVEQMSRIYAGASRVLAWLGWQKNEDGRSQTKDAIGFIRSFMDDPEKAISDARILLHDHSHNHEELEDEAREQSVAHLDLVLCEASDRQLFEEQDLKWKSVKAFFDIEYFHRTWIVQELGLAREATCYTACKPCDRTIEDGVSQASVVLESISWELLGRFVEFMDYSGASLVTHLDLSSWVVHHILMVWETDERGAPTCDFLTGMHWARILRVTDPRDRVYGLLGHPMAVMDGQLVVKPDYSATRGVVYTKLAVNFIRKTKNLYILSLVDHETDPSEDQMRVWDPKVENMMPSWVPDWHDINRTTPIEYTFPAAEAEDVEIQVQYDIDGTTGMPIPHLLTRGWVIDEICAVSRRMETTDFPITQTTQSLRREKAKKNPFWLARMWNDVLCPENYDHHNSHSDFAALTVLEEVSLALALGTLDNDRAVSRVGDKQTLKEHQRSFAAYILEYHELWCSMADVDRARLNLTHNRSLFGSLSANVQDEIRRRAEGATSTGFIECMTWPSMCRVIYRTKSGLIGIGSRLSKPGDLVCRVRGSTVLMTLRKIGGDALKGPALGNERNGEEAVEYISCAHVGPTVVPARMRKGILDGGEFGEKPAQFRLV